MESELHVGTKFFIYFPAKGHDVSAEAIIDRAIKMGRGRILIMDDKIEVKEAAGEMLTQIGYVVVFARDGSEALILYKRAKVEGKNLRYGDNGFVGSRRKGWKRGY